MKKILIIVALIILIPLGFWYFIWPAFRVVEVNDEAPIISETETTNSYSKVTSPIKVSVPIVEIPETPKVVDIPAKNTPAEVPVTIKVVNTPVKTVSTETPETFEIVGTSFHPASGTVRVYKDSNMIRYENFETIDGPRVHVYLTNDLDAIDFVDLGYRKGTRGNINYKIPEGVNINDYKYVIHWCVPFGVLFNYAEIN